MIPALIGVKLNGIASVSKVFVFDGRLGLEQVVKSLGLAVKSVVFLDRVEAFFLQTFNICCGPLLDPSKSFRIVFGSCSDHFDIVIFAKNSISRKILVS